MINIPIEKYEKYINPEISKEKKEEILELFVHNNLRSQQELYDIDEILRLACKKGDFELIKIYLSETIDNESNELSFKINKTNKTASLFQINSKQIDHLVVPRTVKHETDEYLITSICWMGENSSYLRTLKFVEDSAVSTIYSNSFLCSDIEEMYFPSSLKELKEGWCNCTMSLTKIIISPLNDQFLFKNDKYLLGKSDKNSDEFDIFLFVVRSIEKVSIPSNIKIISSYAFEYSSIKEISIPPNVLKICENAFKYCQFLRKVEIPTDSKLQTIERKAFSFSNIEEIYFPSTLKELKEGWCHCLDFLTKIIISLSNDQFIFKDDEYLLGKSDKNSDEFDILLFVNRDIEKVSLPSNIKIISSYSFSSSRIKEIFIPPNVLKISKSAFYECTELTKVEIPTDSKLQTIERKAFSDTKIKEIYFPSTLRELKEGWCHCLDFLTKIIISPSNDQFIFKDNEYLLGKSDKNSDEFDILLFVNRDIEKVSLPSNIKIISSHSFSSSRIKEIYIPPIVSKICEFAFYKCKNLTKVAIPPNSNLQTIESNAFSSSKIDEIFIPPNVSEICECTFYGCSDLTKVEIPTNSNLQIIERSAFKGSKINEIFIPASVLIICEHAFDGLLDLTKIRIPTNSNLQIIKRNAFTESQINEIFIPPSVLKIGENVFSNCFNLTEVEIPKNSNLQIIERFAFNESNIKEIFIPPSVLTICEFAFSNCFNLTKVEIPTNSNLQTIKMGAFSGSYIKEIYFPTSLKELEHGWCHGIDKLRKIIISPSNDQFIFKEDKYLVGKSDKSNNEFDVLLFVNRDVKEICIPSNIKIISSYSFESSKINAISIPPNVLKICYSAFSCCRNLQKVEIPSNSNLQIIEDNAFSESNIEAIFIPANVSEIGIRAFSRCQNLQIVEISEGSKLQSIIPLVFAECPNLIVMIPPSFKIII